MRAAAIMCCIGGFLSVVDWRASVSSIAQAQGTTDKATTKRVEELLRIISQPDARSTKLPQRIAALDELEKLGQRAVPQLVEAVIGKEYGLAQDGLKLLLKIGKPALPVIHARWDGLNDTERWKLMPLREKYEADTVREYARSCLEGETSYQAWQFLLRVKDTSIKDRYYRILRGEEVTKPADLRWALLPGKEIIFEKNEEAKILISLLKPDSWVAKGKNRPLIGREIAPPWWPDGREDIIQIIRERKLSIAAPVLLSVMREKGAGGGYLVEDIVPALIEFRYKEALPELELLAKKPANPKEDVPYSQLNRGEMQTLASEAIKELQRPKP